MAAVCALDPAPSRVPLSCPALLPALPLAPLADDSLEAPHAVSVTEPASAIVSGMARVLVLSFNSMPLDMGPDVGAGLWTTIEKVGSRGGRLRVAR
jgi:hypothetical protein